MKKIKTSALRSLFALAFVAACACGVARADVRDARVISARAGGVNFVAGDVRVRRAGAKEWRELTAEDELRSGDAVRTGVAGRVEILLNPGSYFRAGGSTEFTLEDANLDELRVRLARGSAVIEATGFNDLEVLIAVVTPRALVKILLSGVYRINVPDEGPTEVAVTKGRALVGASVVKGGKVARTFGGGVEVAKLDKENRDALDLWSRDRGKELAKANERLTRRAMTSAFARSSFESIFSASNSGLWFWNTAARCYTFLPFYANWRSPYGYGYDTGVRPVGGPGQTWTPTYNPPGGGTSPGGSWGGGPGSGGSGSGGVTRSAPTPVTPPSRVEPGERPMRERTIEPGSRP